MHTTKTFDLGTDDLTTDEPEVVEWIKAQSRERPA
jgi:hypothetical protein